MRVQLLIYSLILASALGIAHPPAGAMAGDDDAATGNYAEVSYDLALPDGPLDSFTPTNVGGKEESIDLTVFGPDDRTQVLDTTPSPYRTVAFLIGFDKYGDPDLSCSGVMLNYNVVLTAAHCLWQDGAAVPSIAVIPGANGDARPYGSAFASHVSIPQGYLTYYGTSSRWPYDFGLVYLTGSPFGDRLGPYLPLGVLADDYFSHASNGLALAGYPGEKTFGTMWLSKGTGSTFIGPYLYDYLDQTAGESGSPIWAYDTTTNTASSVVSVAASESGFSNRSVRFTDVVVNVLGSYCGEHDCTFAVVHPSATAKAQSMSLAVSTTSSIADSIVATVIVRDATGVAMSGQAVAFSVAGDGCTGAASSTIFSDPNGRAVWLVSFDRKVAGPRCTITATTGGLSQTADYVFPPAVTLVPRVWLPTVGRDQPSVSQVQWIATDGACNVRTALTSPASGLQFLATRFVTSGLAASDKVVIQIFRDGLLIRQTVPVPATVDGVCWYGPVNGDSAGGWPPALYRVDILFNGQVIGSSELLILS